MRTVKRTERRLKVLRNDIIRNASKNSINSYHKSSFLWILEKEEKYFNFSPKLLKIPMRAGLYNCMIRNSLTYNHFKRLNVCFWFNLPHCDLAINWDDIRSNFHTIQLSNYVLEEWCIMQHAMEQVKRIQTLRNSDFI